MSGDNDAGEVTTTIKASTTVTLPAHPHKPTYAELNPRSTALEFLGPWGTGVISVLAPFWAYFIFYACNETTGCHPRSSWAWRQSMEGLLGEWPTTSGQLWRWDAVWVYLGWYAFCVVCAVILPGPKVEGTLMRNGKRKTYKMNGLQTMTLALGLTLGFLLQRGGVETFSWIYDNWVPLLSASLAMSFIQATWVWAYSFFSGELLALGGNSGNIVYDWFLGRPLNPTLPGFPKFDLKTFNEVRPGIIGWTLLNIACACEQYLRNGRVTDSMILVVLFQAWYSFDSLWEESAILNQMDITTDGFGFMLAFGDLVFVPFTYGLQARYLAFTPIDLGLPACAAIVVVKLLGVWAFKGANIEKFDFRNGRNPKNLEFMETERGTKLLTSGWWGVSRHPNYLGDLLIGLSWSLPTGFNTPITYFYFVYFIILLVHRQRRDDHACRQKYGKDWDEYCRRVPYKICPWLY